jgi:hypothetical protein
MVGAAIRQSAGGILTKDSHRVSAEIHFFSILSIELIGYLLAILPSLVMSFITQYMPHL